MHFVVPGEPVGAGRPRAAYVPALGRPRMYEPTRSRDWKACAALQLKAEWGGRAPLDEPVRAIVQFVHTRPKSLLRRRDPDGRLWCCKRPDVDNKLKSAFDAIVDAGVMRDDALIVSTHAESFYARRDEGAGVHIWLELIGEESASDGAPVLCVGRASA